MCIARQYIKEVTMTDTSISILERYQVRKNKKQKNDFIEYLTQSLKNDGYEPKVEKASLGFKNIVVGSPRDAKVIFTAHYDTAPRLPVPNFITPKCLPIYLLYQLFLIAMMLLIAVIPPIIIGVIATLCGANELVISLIPLLIEVMLAFECILLLVGPANRHTANDNTSGVITLIEIMNALPKEKREEAAFVFFDGEEVGLFGSSAFRKKYKNETQGKPIVNFDCVSDGSHILLAVRKKAKMLIPALEEAYSGNGLLETDIATNAFYPSDQINFPMGIGVAALKKSKRLKMLYMDRIHTSRDTVFEEKNIEFLTQGSLKLVEKL